MHALKIYGASDDLVVVTGDVEEEFSPEMDSESGYVAVSDGTLLSVVYDDDGIWRVNRLAEGTSTYSKHEPTGQDYSDEVTLTSDQPFKWVVYSEQVAKR